MKKYMEIYLDKNTDLGIYLTKISKDGWEPEFIETHVHKWWLLISKEIQSSTPSMKKEVIE